MEEVEKHTAKDDVWFVVKNKVYDGTKFLDDHPGGGSSILIVGGTDCTEEVIAAVLNRSWYPSLARAYSFPLFSNGFSCIRLTSWFLNSKALLG